MQTSHAHSSAYEQSPGGAGNSILIASLFSLCVVVVLVLQMLDNANAAVSLAILTTLLSTFTAFWRFRRHGIEPLALFCFLFSLYDGILLLRLASLGDESVLVYPSTFNKTAYASAGVLSTVAATTVLFTAILWESVVEPHLRRGFKTTSLGASTSWFWSGLAMFIAGVTLYYLQFQQFGGYFVALATQRGERFELAGDPNALSYPYLAFVIPGIACMCYGSESNRNRGQRATCYGLIAIWCALVLLQGDRRLVIQAGLTVIGVLSVLRPSALKPKLRAWVFVIVAYVAFSTFGGARSLITMVASGQANLSEAVGRLSRDWSSDWLMPEHTELAGPYLSLLTAVSEDTEHLYGSSYYESFLTVLPRALYPGAKPRVLSEEFASQEHRGTGTVTGWGYNPVAEAFLNFGTLGVVFLFVFWALFFLITGAASHRGTWGTLGSAVLLSEAVNANRIDFRNVYLEVVFFLGGIVLATCITAVVDRILPHRRLSSPFSYDTSN